MSGVLDPIASDLVLSRCRHFGVDVRLNEEVGEVLGRDGAFRGVGLKGSDQIVEGELLGVSTGISPNVEFLEGSGVAMNRGVPVDEHMATNLPNVYAGGDIAEVMDPASRRTRILGLWEPARHHGRVAGINMAGGSETWHMEVGYNATRLYDLDLAAVGESIEKPGDEVAVDFPRTGGRISYRKLVFRSGKLAGGLLLGQRKERVRQRGRLLRKVIAAGAEVSSVRDLLLDPFFDLAGWIDSCLPAEEKALPARATIFGPSPRPTMATLIGKLQPGSPAAPPGLGAPRPPPRATISSLMRPAFSETRGATPGG
ncbi:MAG: FAD-dependent oxidoreductase, partial [Acidimicrobiales bacterium]